jgi:hypothetical protein
MRSGRPSPRRCSPPAAPSSLESAGYDALDHSYLANWRLWDGWYCSTFNNYNGVFFTEKRDLKQVAEQFFGGRASLLNSRYSPWPADGTSPKAAADLLAGRGGNANADGFRKAAAFQMLRGAFNVNSTSKEAWKAQLAGLDGETLAAIVATDANASRFQLEPGAISAAANYIARQRLPNGLPAGRPGQGEARLALWQGGIELSDGDIDALAAGIVREVKRRGPFLSLAEFINRRLDGKTNDLSLKGAIQAAIEDAPGRGDLKLRADSPSAQLVGDFSKVLQTADIQAANYPNPLAAQGSTADGAIGAIDQLGVLTQIGPMLSARSDTFRVRCYGDTVDRNGRVLSRAFAEAVVQRVPDYLLAGNQPGGNNAWEGGPGASTLNPVNERFGRRYQVVSFRWLSPEEI